MVGSETTIALSGVYVGGEQVFSTQDWVDQKVDHVKEKFDELRNRD